jgi:ATP-binding cassette subfamily B protein
MFKLLEWGFFVLQDRHSVKARSAVINNLCKNVFSKVMNLSTNAVKGMSSIDLLKKTDIRNSIRSFIGFTINHFLSLMIDVTVSILILLSINNDLDYIFYILAITIVFIMFFGKYVYKTKAGKGDRNPFEEIQKNENILISSTKDLFSKIALAKAYGSEKLFIDVRKEMSEKERIALTSMRHKAVKIHFIMFAISSISFCVTFWLTLDKLNSSLIDKGDFAAIMIALSSLYWKLQQITYIFEELAKYPIGLSFAFNVLEISQNNNEEKLVIQKNNEMLKNKFSMKNVSFSYGEKIIVKDISIELKNNEALFIVGKSGAGKSTLMSLILSEEKLEHGEILWNDKLIKEQKNITAWIPQKTLINGGTVDFNLSLGKEDATLEEKIEALTKANINHRVEALGGLDKVLDKNILSGGEMQRLAIARAYLSKRPLLLMDEPTSALDIQLEKQFFEEVMALENKIKIIIIHRILAIPNKSKVLVLKDGKIVEYGVIEDLICANGFFAKMYEDAKNEYY